MLVSVMSLRASLLPISAALFALAVAQTNSDHGVRVSGYVVDEAGAAIPDAIVTVVGAGAAVIASTHTDPSGRYVLSLRPGAYDLEVSAAGFKQRTERLSVVPGGTVVPSIALEIKAGGGMPVRAFPQVLIIDGQNNHHWQETTPILRKILEDAHVFAGVTVVTAPPGPDVSGFHPDFAAYDVVVSNYNGVAWPDATKAAFEKYVRDGGGFVSYHAADNAFPDWKEYNEMIAVGGWGGRMNAEGKPCGHHGARLPFQITVRDRENPIVLGLPPVWMHAADELYDSLCGPVENVDVLATAHSDPNNKGTGNDEPMLMAIPYGKGRVFHTTLGHDTDAMQSVDFIVTLQRGAEWAATGKVTQKVPDDFPTADRVSSRKVIP